MNNIMITLKLSEEQIIALGDNAEKEEFKNDKESMIGLYNLLLYKKVKEILVPADAFIAIRKWVGLD